MLNFRRAATTPIFLATLAALGCAGNEPRPASGGDSTAQQPAATAEPVSPAVGATLGEAELAQIDRATATSEPAATDATAPALGAAEATEAKPAKRKPVRTPDVVYVPTPQPVVDKMLEFVKPRKGELLYDLGCGDGRIVVTAAKKYGVKAVGFDIDPERVDEARENVRKAGVEDLVTIEEKDIFTLDLSPANVVTLYLLPELNVKLIPQLEKMKPGSRIVSHDFEIEGIKPLKEFTFPVSAVDESEHDVYLFKIPLQRVKN